MEGTDHGTIVVRVPAEKLDSFVAMARGLAIKVTRAEQVGRDVTDRFVDTQARIANLQSVIARLNALLEQAKTVDEALKVNLKKRRRRKRERKRKKKRKYDDDDDEKKKKGS